MNFRANFIPKLMSTLHPPHFQPDGAGSRGFGPGAQPHADMLPLAHADVTA